MSGPADRLRLDGRWGGRGAWRRPGTTKGGPEGPPLSDEALLRSGYQTVPLQPFVPPEQVRVYEPGEVLDLMMLNTPVELDVAEIV